VPVEDLPTNKGEKNDEDKTTILKTMDALIRDAKARKTYAS
jgi:hypothetical protein